MGRGCNPDFGRDCNAGYKLNLQKTGCLLCDSGKYRDQSRNLQVSGTAINQCYDCSDCLDNQYIFNACITTRDTVCDFCTVGCPTGFYQSTNCTASSDRLCSPCVESCPAGYYLSAIRECRGNTYYDEVLSNCIPCKELGDCNSGFYLSGSCQGTETRSNECILCSNSNCRPDQYRYGCGGYNDTQCLDYTTCNAGYYLAGESRTQDGVCRQCSVCQSNMAAKACTKYEDAICVGDPCGATRPCPRLSTSNRSTNFCNYKLPTPRCGACPEGYGSDGQYCLECPQGSTCNRLGAVECEGQCNAAVLSSCESEWGPGYVSCDQPCAVQEFDSRIPWRGSPVRYDGANCATYFRCSAGHYKSFSSGGTVECEPCARELGQLERWVTEGLSVEDDQSCLWECKRELAVQNETGSCVLRPGREQVVSSNMAGAWANSLSSGVCRQGYTSEEETAFTLAECLMCEPLDSTMARWLDTVSECNWECLDWQAVRRGSQCVPPLLSCLSEGVQRVVGICIPTSFPWNRPGTEKLGWATPVPAPSYTPPSLPSWGVVVTSLNHGIKNRHTVRPMDATQSRNVEGRLCSAVRGWVQGREYVFGSPCNQSFLVYLDLSAGSGGLGVLIGSSTRGWRDGFRTQALFESELYVATERPPNATSSRVVLFVLDRWNCLLREVVVWDKPGSYLTRSYTIWGITSDLASGLREPKCYGLGALAWPRKFWPLLDGWLAFAAEDGLWQFHTETRELVMIMKEDEGDFEADRLTSVQVSGDRYSLILAFDDGTAWSVEAEQVRCPPGFTSLAGAGCTEECRTSNGLYVSQTTGECLPCTVLSCGIGQEPVACTWGSDAYCRACPVVPGTTFSLPGTCQNRNRLPAPPCQPGRYADENGLYCELCPVFTSTLFAGATRVEQCKCLDGLVRRDNRCVGEDIYDVREICPTNCEVPQNAKSVEQASLCAWQCNVGYYRDTNAGLQSQCRPCLFDSIVVQAKTRGDDDVPLSCE